jgi:ribose transport system permease protein
MDNNNKRKQVKERFGCFLKNNIAFVSLLILIILFWIWAGPNFMSRKNWTYISQQLPVVGILAIGMTFAVTGGYIDLSVGSSLGLAGYFAALGIQRYGPIGVVFGLVTPVIIGFVNGALFAYLKIPSFVTTLSTQVIIRAVLMIISNGSAVYISEGMATTGKSNNWLTNIGKFPYVFFIALFVLIIAHIIYNKTTFGWNLRAIGGNEAVVSLFGLQLMPFKTAVFGLVGFFVGIAALVNLGRVGAATTVSGQGMELDAISAVVLGGTPLTGGYGSVVKTFVGALSLVVLSNGITLAGIAPSWNNVAKGLLLIIAVAVALDRKKIGIVK